MTSPVHRTVRFAGPGVGVHPATWGQLDMWREMEFAGDPAHANIVGGGFLGPGHTVDRVVEELGGLLDTYQALRTRFRPRDDGGLVQEVFGEGELVVELHELDDDVPGAVRSWMSDFETEAFDLAAGVPFRARVGTVEGQPRLVLLGCPHVATDFLGARVLFDDLLRRLDGRGSATPRGVHPAEQAALQCSDAGQRVLRRSMDYWRRVVGDGPRVGFAAPAHPPMSPRYWRGGITSRAVPRALDVLAARYRVGTTHVLLAAMAVLVCRRTGHDRLLTRMVVGNRGRPELRNAAGTLSQEVATAVPIDGQRFEDVSRAAWLGSVQAMRHGLYHPDRAAEIVAHAGATLDVCFNDMWTIARNGRGAPGYQGSRSEDEGTVFGWEEKLDRASVSFFLEAFEVFDDTDAIQLSLLADTAHLPPDAIKSALFEFESFLQSMVADDTAKLVS